jgi:hypothetical protein
MKQLTCLLLFGSLSLLLLSCQKSVFTEDTCTCSSQTNSSEIKNLLIAHTWQINEVIDPYSGTRFKRGVFSDGKDFASARYLYKDNGALTGNSWQGNTITNTCYTLLDNRKIQVTAPPCIDIYTIISIGSSELSYKDKSGTIFILGPAGVSETPGNK